MALTSAQQEAIAARGNVLVVAGAGTGKTSTLVERCLGCLVSETPRASLDELLMVTFTEAAAADMRRRIRERLDAELSASLTAGSKGGEDLARHWQEQLALFETAHIGTLHSFCLKLARQHFYELELDPQFAVLPEEEARLLADETLDSILQEHYAGRDAAAEAVQQLIQTQGRGSDRPIRELVLRLHHYTQTLPDPAGWFDAQLGTFAAPEPFVWREWLAAGLADWRAHWLPALEAFGADNKIARECVTILSAGFENPSESDGSGFGVPPSGGSGAAPPASFAEATAAKKGGTPNAGSPIARSQPNVTPSLADFARAFDGIAATAQSCPTGKKTAWIKPLEDFLEESDFLSSLLRPAGDSAADPLAEDWNWVRSQMTTLLQLAREFTAALAEAKRQLGMVDFHDLEQHALRLLWDAKTAQPTRIALQWRKKLRFVFVDEYQDINAAQDQIITALCRDGEDANRFLVGDVKQSIYRFRLANPRIFQGYLADWRGTRGRTIPLVENFRSREGLLQFINSLFGLVMRGETGGVPYDETARLQFGAPKERRLLSSAADPAPRLELQLRIKGGKSDAEPAAGDGLGEVADMEEADKEARMVALRLRELKAEGHLVFDERTKTFRPAHWGDIAVLLRSPGGKSDSYAKEFARLGVPLFVARGRFYETREISDLRSLLQLLDNPLQDLPALAVLHSPLVGLSLNELATLRLASKGPIWSALVFWHESRGANPPSGDPAAAEMFRKVGTFLARYAHWRRLARQVPLSRCLQAVLSETHYADWLLTQPRGEQRHANVERLIGLAQQFDQFQRQGLFRFLLFVEAQERAETEPMVAPVSADNTVRLMSIHQSKGLEFPIVVVADMGKPFNLADLRAEIVLDEEYGLCPQVKPPHTGQRYPSLPYWLARRRQMGELLGEELRLLYVAMTRARDTLLLSGTVTKSRIEKVWQRREQTGFAGQLSARSYADWLGFWYSQNVGASGESAERGANAGLRWFVHDDARLMESGGAPEPDAEPGEPPTDPQVLEKLQQRLSWRYPFVAATHKPAKTSVSELRRLASEQDNEEAASLFVTGDGNVRARTAAKTRRASDRQKVGGKVARAERQASAAGVGSAHHTFLQLVSLDRADGVASLREEASRLEREGALTVEEIGLLDFGALAAFWESELGRQMRAQAQSVRRELPFTARFSAAELAALTGESPEPELEGEFVVVQGVADLVALLPGEIRLVDFKTDSARPDQLADKVKLYAPQLKLYARALSRIYQRPATQCWLYFLDAKTAVAVETA